MHAMGISEIKRKIRINKIFNATYHLFCERGMQPLKKGSALESTGTILIANVRL